jgi:hypothetical protein
MNFLNRYAAAIVVLAFSSMPAWSKSQQIILRGHAYSFDVPSGFKVDHATSADVSYQDDEDNIEIYFFEDDKDDVGGYLVEPKPIEHRGSVSIGWSQHTFHEGAASTPACGGHCFVTVKVVNLQSAEKLAKSDALFEGYIQALASHSFEASGSAVSTNTPTYSKPPVATGNWLVIAGSWPTSQQGKVTARLKLLSENGITAKAVKTDNYSALTPGLVAIVLGPTSRESALAQLETVQSVVPDAFIKESP